MIEYLVSVSFDLWMVYYLVAVSFYMIMSIILALITVVAEVVIKSSVTHIIVQIGGIETFCFLKIYFAIWITLLLEDIETFLA